MFQRLLYAGACEVPETSSTWPLSLTSVFVSTDPSVSSSKLLSESFEVVTKTTSFFSTPVSSSDSVVNEFAEIAAATPAENCISSGSASWFWSGTASFSSSATYAASSWMLDVTIKHNAKAKSNAASNIFFLIFLLSSRMIHNIVKRQINQKFICRFITKPYHTQLFPKVKFLIQELCWENFFEFYHIFFPFV